MWGYSECGFVALAGLTYLASVADLARSWRSHGLDWLRCDESKVRQITRSCSLIAKHSLGKMTSTR